MPGSATPPGRSRERPRPGAAAIAAIAATAALSALPVPAAAGPPAPTAQDDPEALTLQVVTRTWNDGGAIRALRLQPAGVTEVALPPGEFVVGLDGFLPVERRFASVRERRTWAVGVAGGGGRTAVLMPRVADVPWNDAHCLDVSCAPQWRHAVEWPTLDRDAFDAAVRDFARSGAPAPLRSAALECFDADASPCFRFVAEHEVELAVHDARRGERRYRVRFVAAPRS